MVIAATVRPGVCSVYSLVRGKFCYGRALLTSVQCTVYSGYMLFNTIMFSLEHLHLFGRHGVVVLNCVLTATRGFRLYQDKDYTYEFVCMPLEIPF